MIMEDKGRGSAKETAKVKFTILRNQVYNLLRQGVSDYLDQSAKALFKFDNCYIL